MNIKFSVAYTRKEYLSILKDYVLTTIREKKKEKNPDKEITSQFRITKLLVHFVGSITFFFKVRKMPVCKFSFSPEKIVRKTAMGDLEMEWKEVSKIVECNEGMIILDVDDGGMPIPYRCITDEEKQWIHKTQKENVELHGAN